MSFKEFDLCPLNILFVEDDQYYISLLKVILTETLDFQIDDFSIETSAESVLENIEGLGKYDFMVFDVDLPGKSGIELAQEVFQHKHKLATSFVFLTSHQSEQVLLNSYRVGAFDFINKSLPNEVIALKLRRLIDNARQQKYLKQAKSKYLHLYKKLSELIENWSDALVEIDQQLNIIFANPTAIRLLNLSWTIGETQSVHNLCSASDLLGLSWDKAISQADENFSSHSPPASYRFTKQLPNFKTTDLLMRVSRLPRAGRYYIQITEQVCSKETPPININLSVDQITGLSSHSYFVRALEELIRDSHNTDKLLALVLLDISHFNDINLNYGHQCGDHVLVEVAARLRNTLRPNDVIARLNGDLFGIILVSDDLKELQAVLNKLSYKLSRSVTLLGANCQSLNLKCNLGVSTYPNCGETAAKLNSSAQLALDKNKKLPNTSFTFYDNSLDQANQFYMSTLLKLEQANVEQDFSMLYQPQVDLVSANIISAEALIRWQHQGVNIPPSLFIPIAEDSGLIIKISEWIIEKVCQDTQNMLRHAPNDFRMAINISSVQLMKTQIHEFVECLEMNIAKYGISHQNITLELTEHCFLSCRKETIDCLKDLCSKGLNISLDDFGTGYSSLAYIQKLPLAQIKIDKSFIGFINSDEKSLEIVRHLVNLGQALNIDIVAEGIEQQQQLELLKSMECKTGQGFYFEKPVASGELIQLLQKQIEHSNQQS